MAAGGQVGAGLIPSTSLTTWAPAAVATLQMTTNVRAAGLMFGSWWLWTLPARVRFDRVMP